MNQDFPGQSSLESKQEKYLRIDLALVWKSGSISTCFARKVAELDVIFSTALRHSLPKSRGNNSGRQTSTQTQRGEHETHGTQAFLGEQDVVGGQDEEEFPAASHTVDIQVHTPQHLCQLMRETLLCFIHSPRSWN